MRRHRNVRRTLAPSNGDQQFFCFIRTLTETLATATVRKSKRRIGGDSVHLSMAAESRPKGALNRKVARGHAGRLAILTLLDIASRRSASQLR